ncbi:hypothetical protein FIBSPDRAFT_925078 [Athelia psychrophila]|uniref:Uncharacterized protein n=1 Tax=Athelia psychrophila TaxID=1759441 RepID=A0A166VCQ6_9AGAM|nr:hypothetical protein FIBSPDRAFT_925078 [Fibularhizoctonia sp. CBS 109695]
MPLPINAKSKLTRHRAEANCGVRCGIADRNRSSELPALALARQGALLRVQLPSLKAKAKRKADSEMEGLKALPARRRFKFQPVTVIFSAVTSTVCAITRANVHTFGCTYRVLYSSRSQQISFQPLCSCALCQVHDRRGNEIRLLVNLH